MVGGSERRSGRLSSGEFKFSIQTGQLNKCFEVFYLPSCHTREMTSNLVLAWELISNKVS